MLRALVVGIDEYRDPLIPALKCARNDAQAVAKLFNERIVACERNVRVLLDAEANRQAIISTITEDMHREVEEDDLVLVYFAGHGSPERRGPTDRRSRYLIAHDTEYARIHATGIDMTRDVGDWLARLGCARLVVLILDSCFSGATGGRTFVGPLLKSTPELPYLDAAPKSFREVDLGRGRAILCACDDDQLAREDRDIGHGVFTGSLLAALMRGRSGQNSVSLGELYDEVERDVRVKTNGTQTPVVSVDRGRRIRLPAFG